MKILGVKIDNLTKNEILEKIEFFLNEDKFHQIATINPEFILKAQRDENFRNILNDCDLNVADGIGLKYAFVRYGGWLKNRIAGVDLMHETLHIADRKKLSVFLAVSKNGLSSFDEIKKSLEKMYPSIKFFGEEINPSDATYNLEPTTCDLFFCNFGAPEQEKFINLIKNDTIRLAMGVGGSFDFVTGRILRAPKVMREFGLEWLWRLIQEPKFRAMRIFRATVVFPLRILINR